MEPVRQHHSAFQVAGLTARTTNREENDPATARIGALWNRFFGEETYRATPHRTSDAPSSASIPATNRAPMARST